MEMLHVPPMILGSISIPLVYHFVHRPSLRMLWGDVQIRTFVILTLAGTGLLILLLMGTTTVADPARAGLFQFVSALSTTGWQTSNIGDWEPAAVLVIVGMAMVPGGAAGATVGGIKLIRVYLILRGIAWNVRRVFLPDRAVVVVPLGPRTLVPAKMTEELAKAATFALLYLAILLMSVVVTRLALSGDFTLADVVFEAASAQGTVGLSSNITGPDMPRAVEVVYIGQMWLGRLEIIPVLVLLRAMLVGIGRR